MKFHEWKTMYQMATEAGRNPYSASVDEFYTLAHRVAASKKVSAVDLNMLRSEQMWYAASRPYYKAWPAITESLEKIKLDIPASAIPSPPFDAMCIRFAENFGTISAIFFHIERHAVLGNNRQVLLCFTEPGTSRFARRNGGGIALQNDDPIEAGIERFRTSVTSSCESGLDKWTRCLRIAIMTVFIADDPSIITPDVLSSDRDRYESETDEAWKQRAVDRARRRGIVGWNIGADYEVCPHYRRPHFGIRHTGKGKTVPRIVPIKGAVVHRSKLTEVPTGHMLPDGTEVENGSVVEKTP